jgi:hypothetical protein
MPKLVAPLKKEFRIKRGPGLSVDDPIIVGFRQAFEGDVDTRQEMLSRRLERRWAGEVDEDYSESLELINPSRQRAVEVYLTLTSCNIKEEVPGHESEPEEQRPLRDMFTFLEANSQIRVNAKNFDIFFKKWGQLDPEWALSIHTCCLIANPTWGMAVYDEEDIEPILTEGEEPGASEAA